jgi:hypothetical protein
MRQSRGATDRDNALPCLPRPAGLAPWATLSSVPEADIRERLLMALNGRSLQAATTAGHASKRTFALTTTANRPTVGLKVFRLQNASNER